MITDHANETAPFISAGGRCGLDARGEPIYGYRAYEDLYASVRDGDWKLLAYRSGTLKLYDIANDIGETNDLASANSVKVSELETKLAAWERKLGVGKYSGVQ